MFGENQSGGSGGGPPIEQVGVEGAKPPNMARNCTEHEGQPIFGGNVPSLGRAA